MSQPNASGANKRARLSDGDEGGEHSASCTRLKLTMPEDDESEDEKETKEKDWSDLSAKKDHASCPLFVGENQHCFLERFSPLFKDAEEFMIAISEPVSRCEYVNEYEMTQHSLHAAVSIGLTTDRIIERLRRLCKTELPPSIENFIRDMTAVYGKVKMVIVDNRFYLETPSKRIYENLEQDDKIAAARIRGGQGLLAKAAGSALPRNVSVEGKGPATMGEIATVAEEDLVQLEAIFERQDEDEDAAVGAVPGTALDVPQNRKWHIEIQREKYTEVKIRCLKLDLPVLEEYDFANDTSTDPLDIEAKPGTFIRSYQEKALSKMFSHGRARSGFIVLPCGAGKTLVGITAVANIKKCAVVVCNTNLAVMQWKEQFMRTWTNVKERDITCLVSGGDDLKKGLGNLLITTYPMMVERKDRAKDTETLLEKIKSRQWGILVLDEVHLSFAEKYFRIVDTCKAHCKLGLTATLVREDDKISELKNLIGPKLYEADWQDLSNQGYLARVQCVEVWCPMTPLFMKQYLESGARERKDLWIMNPNKLAAVEYLVKYWEDQGHKILVFSDDLRPVLAYSDRMGRKSLSGGDDSVTREEVLRKFRDHSSDVKTVFMSSVGDAAIDLPDASVIIQISSNFGSRMKEAQRLGRILRPKPNSTAEFNAHFYTLVSKDTQEMYYSTKRQRYLVDQGYAFKGMRQVVTRLEQDGKDLFTQGHGGKYGKKKLEGELLQLALESRKEAREYATTGGGARAGGGGAVRGTGTMATVSGGQGTMYKEMPRTTTKSTRDQQKHLLKASKKR